jgi:hypothetical protein
MARASARLDGETAPISAGFCSHDDRKRTSSSKRSLGRLAAEGWGMRI